MVPLQNALFQILIQICIHVRYVFSSNKIIRFRIYYHWLYGIVTGVTINEQLSIVTI